MALAVAALLCAVSAHADEGDCIAARYKAAGKYASCEAKAFSAGFGAGENFDQDAFLKCRQKYAATWPKLQAKYPATSCALARFVDNGSTITDNLTQLEWEKKDSSDGSPNLSNRHDVDNRYTWSATSTNADGDAFTDFLDNLNSAGFAGQHDWRLPTIVELQTILATDAAPCLSSPCVADPVFLPTQSYFYWSSTTYQSDPSNAWSVNFNYGMPDALPLKTNILYARGVRAGS